MSKMKHHRKRWAGICALALALSIALPAGAFATQSPFVNNAATSTWTLEAQGTNLSATVTLVCPLTVDAVGEFNDPTTGSYYIENDSVFPIHVSNVKATIDDAWHNVAQTGFSAATASNVFWAKLAPNQGSAGNAIDINNLQGSPTAGQWDMDAAGGDKEQLPIETTGAAKSITNEISTVPSSIFTITYTLARGAATEA